MSAERQWRRIREYDAAGNVAAARIACMSRLQAAPHDVAAWQYLAALETKHGRYRAAHQATIQAADAALRTASLDAPSQMTLGLLRFDEWDAVRQFLSRIDRRSPPVLRQAPVLAQHVMLAGDDAGALAFCDEVRGLIRPDARLEYVAALSSLHLGRTDDAAALFERAISIDRDFSPAYRSLAYQRPAGAARIPRLEAAVGRCRQDPDAMADLCYALYRECEHAGRTEVAWTWLARGAAAARAACRSAVAERGERDSEIIGAAPPPVDEMPTIIFIVGLPRTGTTVLERMLGRHSQVSAGGELNAFHAALCHGADAFLPHPTATTTMPRVADAAAVGSLYRRAIGPRYGGRRILIDKNPANFLYADAIARALPEARIVCLRRTPMDACFSNLRERFEGDAYPYSYAFDTVAAHYAWFDRLRGRFEDALPRRFLTVDYEALVSTPKTTCASVLGFCGLDYEEGCELIERNASPVATASSAQVREPVHTRGIGAWSAYRHFLTPLQDALRAEGYSL